MTPGQAQNFAEDDEDPQRIFARFDAARQIAWGRAYIEGRYAQAGHQDDPGWYDRGGELPQ